MDIDGIEDKLIQTVEALALFRNVASAGRQVMPQTLIYPSAYIYFESMQGLTIKSRAAYKVAFEIIVANKNLRSEGKAAADIYALIIAVRNAIHNKSLTIENIESFTCTSVKLTDYEAGEIAYTLHFEANMYL